MNSIRFTSREAFIAALEARRKFWHDYDTRRAREHFKAEQKYLTDARAKMRAALKLDYEGLAKLLKSRYGDLNLGQMPSCPALMEPKVDHVIACLKNTMGKTFTVDSKGTWADAHNLLTWDPDAKTSVC